MIAFAKRLNQVGDEFNSLTIKGLHRQSLF